MVSSSEELRVRGWWVGLAEGTRKSMVTVQCDFERTVTGHLIQPRVGGVRERFSGAVAFRWVVKEQAVLGSFRGEGSMNT